MHHNGGQESCSGLSIYSDFGTGLLLKLGGLYHLRVSAASFSGKVPIHINARLLGSVLNVRSGMVCGTCGTLMLNPNFPRLFSSTYVGRSPLITNFSDLITCTRRSF